MFSLGAGESHVVRKKASTIENLVVEKFQQGGSTEIDFDKLRKYELDLNRGIAKANSRSIMGAFILAIPIGNFPNRYYGRIKKLP